MMISESERSKVNWYIYQIDVPGPSYQRHVVASSVRRALEISITSEDQLDNGEMLLVSNVTRNWICHSPLASQSTWSLLRERREGVVEYDLQEGWERISMEK